LSDERALRDRQRERLHDIYHGILTSAEHLYSVAEQAGEALRSPNAIERTKALWMTFGEGEVAANAARIDLDLEEAQQDITRQYKDIRHAFNECQDALSTAEHGETLARLRGRIDALQQAMQTHLAALSQPVKREKVENGQHKTITWRRRGLPARIQRP
jgi:hypothetical protein